MKKYYLCGPTVYNYVHIGNMRPILTFDLMIRAQRFLGEDVFFLHNITDIDDKIINKALAEQKTEKEIAEYYTEQYLQMLKAYNIEIPNKIAKVTEHLDTIYDFINDLITTNNAYKDGVNVFFDVIKNKDFYGEVSNQKISKMNFDQENLNKQHPADFTLWKDTKIGIKYDAPFGTGRPGWHTECVAMIKRYFGNETIDIHGGGSDLTFPHHENENIQFRALTNNPLAKQWIHFGTINMNNEKMSKSLGNILLAKDYLNSFSADSLRLIFLTASYTKPINITDELMVSNQNMIEKFNVAIKKIFLEDIQQEINQDIIKQAVENVGLLNFAQAMKIIHDQYKQKQYRNLYMILKALGFNIASETITDEDKQMYQNWKLQIENKNYEEADKLREALKQRKLI
ncbi:class I tRNA ligase family protein [[Mycoplasma] gypis]|uniref:Cysteine--tRNA ligase n=1 Tax=[Mycoplasma] gypis TaxID=92404 RepID=A0ABZ2RQ32_9BACT|nr:class I tRNA ligase family protein [[Mycoplasma] gypis]MBN0919079.1 class I tRNA ligase family protein [[Mycoplasma] gypis]